MNMKNPKPRTMAEALEEAYRLAQSRRFSSSGWGPTP